MVVELPLCRWRRQPTGPGRHICISPRIRCNADGIPDEFCGTCKYRDHPPDQRPRLTCRHFGQLLKVAPVRLAGRSDGASVLSRYHRCIVHGECTPNVAQASIACCMTCPDHDPDWTRDRAGDVRHLTYFVYPAGPWWRWNVDQLLARLSLFNGRRIVAVATDDSSEAFETVAEAFAGLDVQLQPFANDPGLKEMVAHRWLLAELEAYRADGDVTFYGHGKGAGSHAYGEGVKRWAEEMYSGLLDYWPAVRRQLRDHAAVGVFRRILSPAPAAHVPWHYSGSFRWVRNRDLYSRNWRVIDGTFYGSETYPGRHFTADESACLYGEFAYGGVGLYVMPTWHLWAQAAADDWRAQHVQDRKRPQLVTVILPTHRQAVLVHEAVASVIGQTTDAWQLVIMDSGRLAGEGHFARYAGDGRIQAYITGDGELLRPGVNDQAWKINEAWRRGYVRGDLITHLADDDVYQPTALADFLRHAEANPGQAAWYGKADRVRVYESGFQEDLGPLGLRGVGTPVHSLRSHVDGLQVFHRRGARTDWPEEPARAREVDGWWMEALCRAANIHPAEVYVGAHRHTPLSRFTQ